MKTVPLYGKKAAGRVARVDDGDYELVMAHRWTASESHGNVYAITNVPRDGGGYRSVLMHTLITAWPRADHVDHDGLNNQRSNLRPATTSQNLANQRVGIRGGSSRYKGAYWHKVTGKWGARIGINGKGFHLGLFDDEADAARAYDAAAVAAWGEFACLNFPDPGWGK